MHDKPIQKMKTLFLFTVMLAGGLAASAAPPVVVAAPEQTPAPPQQDPDAELRSFVIVRQLNPLFTVAPRMSATMQLENILKGSVRFAVQIDAEGRPVDWIILAYTNKDLAEATRLVLKDWRFEPETIEGHPVSAQTEFNMDFRGPDVVTISQAMDQQEFLFRNMGLERLEFELCPVSKLDRIPIPVNVVKPLYSFEARDKGIRGNVEVRFYINEKGEVRLPAVLNADRIDIAEAALDAVRQWKFEPPTRNGKPVLISAAQHFDFGTGTTTTTVQ